MQHPRSANFTHVPELEQLAYNQMPKSSDWTELKLMRYENTNLYQWYGRQNGSIFQDPCDGPFVIENI